MLHTGQDFLLVSCQSDSNPEKVPVEKEKVGGVPGTSQAGNPQEGDGKSNHEAFTERPQWRKERESPQRDFRGKKLQSCLGGERSTDRGPTGTELGLKGSTLAQ